MTTIYLNMKTNQGRETVDELDSADFETRKAFRKECSRLIGEYNLCNMAVYQSTRACANWK